MAKMIKLSDGKYVATDQIAELEVSCYGTHIDVRLKDGSMRSYSPGYGESVYRALDRLVKEVNEEVV